MRIGELAKQSGIPASTIRYYEQIGLLPDVARTAGGSRRYSDASLFRLRMVRGLQSMGFALEDMHIFFNQNQCAADRSHIMAAVDDRLGELGELINNLVAKRDALAGVKVTMQEMEERGTCPDEATLQKLAAYITGDQNFPADLLPEKQD